MSTESPEPNPNPEPNPQATQQQEAKPSKVSTVVDKVMGTVADIMDAMGYTPVFNAHQQDGRKGHLYCWDDEFNTVLWISFDFEKATVDLTIWPEGQTTTAPNAEYALWSGEVDYTAGKEIRGFVLRVAEWVQVRAEQMAKEAAEAEQAQAELQSKIHAEVQQRQQIIDSSGDRNANNRR